MRLTAIFILSSGAVWDPVAAQLRLNAGAWWGAGELTSWTTAWTRGCSGRPHTCKDPTQQEHFLMLRVSYKWYKTGEMEKVNVSLQVAKCDTSCFTWLYRNPNLFKMSNNIYWECFHSNSNWHLLWIFPLTGSWETSIIHIFYRSLASWSLTLYKISLKYPVHVKTALSMGKMQQNIEFSNLAQAHLSNTSKVYHCC